jgi:hypothetical protein
MRIPIPRLCAFAFSFAFFLTAFLVALATADAPFFATFFAALFALLLFFEAIFPTPLSEAFAFIRGLNSPLSGKTDIAYTYIIIS